MQFLTRFLAGFIDKFKVANPTAFVVIQFVMGLIIFSASSCAGFFEFCASDTFVEYKDLIVGFLIAVFGVTGSRTSRFVGPKQ